MAIGGGTFSGDIVNSGSMTIFRSAGAAQGISVQVASFGGDVTNSGSIKGFGIYGIEIEAQTFTGNVVNNGTVKAQEAGIAVDQGSGIFTGNIVNTGTVSAVQAWGILFEDSIVTGNIVNSGTILGDTGILGVVPTFSGGITNTGTISASTGIQLDEAGGVAGVSLFSSGTIIGTGFAGTAIQFGGATNTLTLGPDFLMIGNVLGSGSDIFQLGGNGSGAFNLGEIGTQYTGFTTFNVVSASWTVTGTGNEDWSIAGGSTLQLGDGGTSGLLTGAVLDNGVLAVDRSDVVTIDSSISGTGAFEQLGTGTVILAEANSYSGGTTVESGTLLIDGSTANSAITVDSGGALGGTGTAGAVTVDSGGTFAPGDPSTFTVASLTLNSGSTFDEQIGGTTPGTGGATGYDQTVVESAGAILLGGATLDASLVDGFTPGAGDTFTIINNETGDPVSGTFNGLAEGAAFALDGDYFKISYDGGSNNQDVVLTDIGTSPCYCPGTLIRTKYGNKRVEKLQIGDEVMTASGVARPIKWIGRRSYGGRFVMGRKDVLPVCIKAGALDDNVPRRDLWISPNHAMYFKDAHLDGVLIEARDLINGVSIVQAERANKVEYVHIELESHDVIIAEGALPETFIDDDSRGMFHNAHEYRTLYTDAPAALARYSAPRRDDGYEVEAIRQRLALRAGLVPSDETARAGDLRGYVDRVSTDLIEGWAQNVDHPEAPVCLDIYAGGRLIKQVLADRYRADLVQAGMGSGHHSFVFAPPTELAFTTDAVEVRRSLDGAPLMPTANAWRAPQHVPVSADESGRGRAVA